jgi:WD40 repeat protein
MPPSRSIAVLACVFLATSALRAAAEDSVPRITFLHQPHKQEVAEEPVEQISFDKQFTLKVEGEKRKPIVRLYDAAKKPIGPAIPQDAHRVTALAISRDNQTIATAVGNFSNDWGKVRVWDATSGKLVAEYQGKPYLGEVFAIAFSEDGQTLTITAAEAGGK